MDGIGRSRGWDKEIQHSILPMEQLVLSDNWARKQAATLLYQLPVMYPASMHIDLIIVVYLTAVTYIRSTSHCTL